MKKPFLVGLVILILVSPVGADVTVKLYMQGKNSELLKNYIAGVGTGLSWANIYSFKEFQKGLYCPPKKLALNTDNYRDILHGEIEYLKKHGTLDDDTFIEMLLIQGLIRTFPCNKNG
jgi:hypothetical protein